MTAPLFSSLFGAAGPPEWEEMMRGPQLCVGSEERHALVGGARL